MVRYHLIAVKVTGKPKPFMARQPFTRRAGVLWTGWGFLPATISATLGQLLSDLGDMHAVMPNRM